MKGEGYLVAGINTTSAENMELLELYEGNPDYQTEDIRFGKALYRNNPFAKQMAREGLSKDDMVQLIHEETGLPKEEINISRIVRQIYYDPERFIEEVQKEGFITLNREVVKENPSRQVVLFKNTKS
ncbi:MAG: hypothetical protein KDK64_05150 [Chlamydiia bacterium]|nr:hypothetical protein [Chlamydiia bacterium]